MRISDWSSDVCSSDLAERRDRLPAGIMTRARAEELGAVGLGPARQTRIIKLGALSDHQPRRLKIHTAFRERMLNPLILADQTAAYNAPLRICDRAAQCVLAARPRPGPHHCTFGGCVFGMASGRGNVGPYGWD